MANPGSVGAKYPASKTHVNQCPQPDDGWDYKGIFTVGSTNNSTVWQPGFSLILPLEKGWMRKVTVYVVRSQTVGTVTASDQNWEFYALVGSRFGTEPVATGIYKPSNGVPGGLLFDFEGLLFNQLELWFRLDHATRVLNSNIAVTMTCAFSKHGSYTNGINPIYGNLVTKGTIP